MKVNVRKQATLGVSLVLLVGLVSFGIVSGKITSFFSSNTETSVGKPADDIEGALEYEFYMTKDPATGKIPEGIYAAERAQANEIRQRQENLLIPEMASYNFVGPDNLGGRVRSVTYDVRYNGVLNQTILACGVSGGVFKSVDDGATWVRKSQTGDHFSCTSIAQDTRAGFQDTWYYSVGEAIGNTASGFGAYYTGNGVYKSVDNGETWARLPSSNNSILENFDNRADLISKVIVEPINGNVYIAAISAIQRSTNGGTTWETVLNGDFSNGGQVTDIIVTSTGTFYAALPGNAGSNNDGVYRSATGATGSWTKISGTGSVNTPAGWNAAGAYGRVVLANAPGLPTRVYALYHDNTTSVCGGIEKPEAEFYYWTEGLPGTWTDISATLPDEPGCSNGNDPFAAQGGYNLVVAVKPDDANTVFIGGTNSYRSTDAGATWTRIGGYNSPANYNLYPNSHSDIHNFAFPPTSSTTMLSGDDGGIQRTTNNLAANVAWTQINNGFRTYQYYYVVNDPRNANNKVMGGAQDNGTTRNIGGTGSNFELIFGGDGVSVGLSDPAASGGVQYEYLGFQNGNIFRLDVPVTTFDQITPTGEADTGLFITLFKVDSDNTQTLYYANDNLIYRTTSASTVTSGTWTQMTGIGTAVDPSANPDKIDISTIGMTRGAYNPATSSLFFGTQDGRVFRLDNPTGVAPGSLPVNITGAGFPANAYVSSIAVNPTNDDTVMVTFSNYGVTSVFLTNNANAPVPTWTNIEGNLTLPSFRSSAIINTGTPVFFVGTSAGLYRLTNYPANTSWVQEGSTNIGNAVVSSLDLRVSDNKLLVGTHGYGIWSAIAPTAASVSISGRIITSSGLGVSDAVVRITEKSGDNRTVRTNSFGYYRFDNLEVGQSVTVEVSSRRYQFETRVVNLADSLIDFNFVAMESTKTRTQKIR